VFHEMRFIVRARLFQFEQGNSGRHELAFTARN
jgi:hypothetical protein